MDAHVLGVCGPCIHIHQGQSGKENAACVLEENGVRGNVKVKGGKGTLSTQTWGVGGHHHGLHAWITLHHCDEQPSAMEGVRASGGVKEHTVSAGEAGGKGRKGEIGCSRGGARVLIITRG